MKTHPLLLFLLSSCIPRREQHLGLIVQRLCLLATPIAWYFLNGWLANYEYRSAISLWIFVVAGLAALVVTLLIVNYQAVKAALTNPVEV